MIIGFNTDIEYEGVLYHVQTEDKGLGAPVIVSLVYVGGAILARKRTSYHDLITTGFDEMVLAERLQRQHMLICAALRFGRIAELKRLSEREAAATYPSEREAAATYPSEREAAATYPSEREAAAAQSNEREAVGSKSEVTLPPVTAPRMASAASAPSVTRLIASEIADFARHTATLNALHVSLLEEVEFRAGHSATLRLCVKRGAEAVSNGAVKIKILGTAFQPVAFSINTDKDGIASVRLTLPNFTRGRGMILISSAAGGYEAELRRIIRSS